MRKILNQIVRYSLLIIIRTYQLLLSPILPPACRFLPSCSDYAAEALQTHGILKGSILTFKRLSRCHPWGKSGYDPVPQTLSKPSNHCCEL